MKTAPVYKVKTRSLSVSNILAFGIIMVASTACGGGGDSSGNNSTSTLGSSTTTISQQDVVSQPSAVLVAQTGATVVPGTTLAIQALDPTADIGDTWRVVPNQDSSSAVKVLSTQYGLGDISDTYTQSTSGSVTTYTGTSTNGSFMLKLDTHTCIIGGSVVSRTRNSGIAGSGCSVPSDTTKLAGDCFFIGASRNASSGGVPTLMGGTFRIAANETDAALCGSGLINASGTCSVVSGSSTPGQYAPKLVRNAVDGLIHIQQNGPDFGALSFQAGDCGPALIIDRFGYNQDTPPVLRMGVSYASEQQVLSGIEPNGTWICSDRGAVFGAITIDGTTVKTADTSGASTAETLYFNDTSTSTGLVIANGIATSVADGRAPSTGVIVLLLSSSMFTVERGVIRSVGVHH